jgi:membrane protein YqaA with SNARE-associated domain
MDWVSLITIFGLYLGSFVVGFIGGILPITTIEFFLLGASLIAPRNSLLLIVVLALIGQMIAKSLFYFAGRGVFKIAIKKNDKKAKKVINRFKKWENKTGTLIFISGFISVPPFYLTSFFAGSFKISYLKFLIWGSAGRLLRFVIIILFPQLLKTWFF